MSYAEQGYHGSFECKGCLMTFDKADPNHGASGYCCQCEIARGMILLHKTDEENREEQIRTKIAIAGTVIHHPFRSAMYKNRGIHTNQ